MISPALFLAQPLSLRLFLLALFFLAIGALLPLLLPRRAGLAHPAGATGGLLGCLCGGAAALVMLGQGDAATFTLPWATAGITLSLHFDGLAAFFLLPLFVVCLCAAAYAPSYLGAATARDHHGLLWFFFNILVASMALVLTSANGLQFIMAWEAMSLSSFFLVITDYRNNQVRRAGWLYLLATHIGTAFLFVFFLEAARLGNSLDFSSFSALQGLAPPSALLFFLLIVIGFGAKAGLFPLHVWLPDAHPAAPSHVSAIMSGVMIKTAVYGFLRMLTFLPALPAWCGLVLLVLGMTGALFGILMAAQQQDIKRCLAYSTVENIGLIFFGLGLWLYATSSGHATVAALALTGSLLHVWNHALFKGLLFLGAGSLVHATGTRDLSHLGGLLRRLPATGGLLLVGGMAICALPPFNGFVSEWLLYLGLLTMGQAAQGANAVVFLLFTAGLALVGGLVLLTMGRLLGLALLGEPRRPQSAACHESPWPMPAAMAPLALCCLAIGLAPAWPLRMVASAMAVLGTGALAAPTPPATLPTLPVGWGLTAGLLLVLTALACLLRHLGGRRWAHLTTWGCGFTAPTRRMTYMAGGYSQLLQDSFLCHRLQPLKQEEQTAGLFPAGATYSQHSVDPVMTAGFTPFFSRLAERAYLFRRLQAGHLDVYLFYIFVSTILLLGWALYQS